jgi:hypothetical protein
VEKDDLFDVVLEGRRLVSDDPKTWLVPAVASSHEDMLDWWQSLMSVEHGNAKLALDADTKSKLLWLTDLHADLVAANNHTAPQQAKIRSVVRQVCHLGLDTEQAARLLNLTQVGVYVALYCNQTMWPDDIAARIKAERMLREGTSVPDIARKCALDGGQVKTLADMLGIERSSQHPNMKPEEVRNRALALRAEGYDNHQISQILADDGHQVPAGTISQWYRRYGRGAA